MPLTKKPILSLKETQVERRKFISTGVFGGLSLALTPGLETALASNAEETINTLPSPADSLSLYVLLLDRLKNKLLNPYFDLLNCLSGELTSRYAQLKKDVAELEALVPELRSRTETTGLRSVTEVGYASASVVRVLARERVMLTNAGFAITSLGPDELRNTLTEFQRQRGSLTLSPKAAELLRKILDEIRDLDKPSTGLSQTSNLMTDLNEDLDGEGGKMTTLRSTLISAILALVEAELSKEPKSGMKQAEAKTLVESAITQLKNLDSYAPPQSLQTYLTGSRANRCKEAKVGMAVAGLPTESLRDLLAGTVKWIESGGQLTRRITNDVQFIKASSRAPSSPALFEMWSSVRGVLGEHLPPASKGRTFMCLSLIAPILIGYDVQRRTELINDQLTNLIPGGASDRDSVRRRKAAVRLASL